MKNTLARITLSSMVLALGACASGSQHRPSDGMPVGWPVERGKVVVTAEFDAPRGNSRHEGIDLSVRAEHGFRHTALIHTNNVRNMTKMGRVMDTTLFVKNGPCMSALGLGGEGYLSFSIATPTGEGVTTPLTFTRERRCSLIDDLCILGK